MTTPHNTQRELFREEFTKRFDATFKYLPFGDVYLKNGKLIQTGTEFDAFTHENVKRFLNKEIDLIHSEYEETRKKELEEIVEKLENLKLVAEGTLGSLYMSQEGYLKNRTLSDCISIIKSKINPTV